MAPGSSSTISKQIIIFLSFAGLLLGTSTMQSAAQPGVQKPRTKSAPVAVATPSPEVPEQVDKVAEVQIKSAVKVLQEGHPGVVYVIIRNISNVPVTITQIDVTFDGKDSTQDSAKESIKATITGFTSGQTVTVPPQHAQKLRIDLLAAGQIEEGAHLLLVQVDLRWNKDNKPLTGSLYASHDFNVEVLALSGVLTVLGASSLLFLPGFLAVTVFFVLNRLWGKYLQGEKWQLDWKSPEFWMAALTVSLVAPSIYGWVSQWWLGEKRDYRKGYGLSDVVLIWFSSIVLSIVCWTIYRFIRETIARNIEKKRRSLADYGESLELDPGDQPSELLDKLARRSEWESLSLFDKLHIIRNPTAPAKPRSNERKARGFPEGYPEPVEIRVNSVDESYFLTGRLKREAAQVLVVPPIEYMYIEPDPDSGNVQTSYEAFRTNLDAEIRRDTWDLGRIAELFVQGSSSGWLSVNWDKLGSGETKTPVFVRPGQLNRRPDSRVRFFQPERSR